MEMPRPLVVSTLKIHPFHISHLFLNMKLSLLHLNFEFTTRIAYALKYAKMVVKCETEMRSVPPQFQ